MDKRNRDYSHRPKREFEEIVVEISRIARTVKGGRRIRFRALVVMGNKKGKLGVGVAKANEVVLAIEKAKKRAKKNMILVPIVNETIPDEIIFQLGAGRVMLKPAGKGSSVVAGGAIRAMMDVAGIKNVVTKNYGSRNKMTMVKTTFEALKQLKLFYDSKES